LRLPRLGAKFAVRLASSGVTAWASGGIYTIANVVHLLGLVLLLGSIGIVDLRLMGAFPALPAQPLAKALRPLGIAGLVLMVLSGSIVFAADAGSLVGSATLRWKLIVIALAIGNAVAFHWLVRPGWTTRVAAAVSLAAWLTAATLGRMIAYS